MDLPASIWPSHHLCAIDARAIVRVEDPHGGLSIYAYGRPTHYLLDGEWYAAAPRRGGDSDALTTQRERRAQDYPDREGRPEPPA